MNRETIEKAADNYSAEIMPAYSDGYFEKYQLADAFETGAHWRINSVWHDYPEEKPNRYTATLVETRNGIRVLIEKSALGWNFYARSLDVTRWAYLDDFLPERKEEAL